MTFAILQTLLFSAKVSVQMAKRMTRAQRRQHYHDWLASGMTRTGYAALHHINIKSSGTLTRALAARTATASVPPRPLMPVTLSTPPPETATLRLRAASVTSTPAGIAAIIRELNLC